MIILGGTNRDILLLIYSLGFINIVLCAYIIYCQFKLKVMLLNLGKDNSIMANMIKDVMGAIKNLMGVVPR